MNDKIHKWVNTGLIALVLILVLVGGNQSDLLGGATRYPHGYIDTADGYYVDGVAIIDASGNVDGNITTGSLTVGSGGSAITAIVCTSSAVYNPDSVSTTTPYLFDLTPTGYVNGDALYVSVATTTQSLAITANASSTANVVSTMLYAPDYNMAAVDLATTTIEVCRIAQ